MLFSWVSILQYYSNNAKRLFFISEGLLQEQEGSYRSPYGPSGNERNGTSPFPFERVSITSDVASRILPLRKKRARSVLSFVWTSVAQV